MSGNLDYRRFSNDTLISICNNYKRTKDINLILSNYPGIFYNDVISILTLNNFNKTVEPCQLNISDKKIMLISDTHYGSIYDNVNYAYYALDFAKKHDIKTVFHGGDVLEGNIKDKIRDGLVSKRQAEYFINNYPRDKDIMTHVVLGNHDYLALSESSKAKKILNSRDDIDIMGFKKIFFNWKGVNVGFQHNVKNYKLLFDFNLFPSGHEDLNFLGHSHFFHIKECEAQNYIYIPAMCDDPLNKTNPRFVSYENALKPGFLTVEIFNNYIIITHYYFEDKQIIKSKEHVRVLKNTSI